MNVFQFQLDGQTHAVLSGLPRARRGKSIAICTQRFTADAKRLHPNDPEKAAPTTCDPCLSGVVAFHDLMELTPDNPTVVKKVA